jgi:hypothetical protein
MKRTVWILGVLALLAFHSVDGRACTCNLPQLNRTLRQQVNQSRKHARAVFSGSVLRIDEAGDSMRVTFKIEGSWKGALSKEVVVVTGRGGGDCGYRFEVGQNYLVYAYGVGEAGLGTNICQRTMPLAPGAGDLKILGKPKRPTS